MAAEVVVAEGFGSAVAGIVAACLKFVEVELAVALYDVVAQIRGAWSAAGLDLPETLVFYPASHLLFFRSVLFQCLRTAKQRPRRFHQYFQSYNSAFFTERAVKCDE